MFVKIRKYAGATLFVVGLGTVIAALGNGLTGADSAEWVTAGAVLMLVGDVVAGWRGR